MKPTNSIDCRRLIAATAEPTGAAALGLPRSVLPQLKGKRSEKEELKYDFIKLTDRLIAIEVCDNRFLTAR